VLLHLPQHVSPRLRLIKGSTEAQQRHQEEQPKSILHRAHSSVWVGYDTSCETSKLYAELKWMSGLVHMPPVYEMGEGRHALPIFYCILTKPVANKFINSKSLHSQNDKTSTTYRENKGHREHCPMTQSLWRKHETWWLGRNRYWMEPQLYR
jgi:hypothetical protein